MKRQASDVPVDSPDVYTHRIPHAGKPVPGAVGVRSVPVSSECRHIPHIHWPIGDDWRLMWVEPAGPRPAL